MNDFYESELNDEDDSIDNDIDVIKKNDQANLQSR
jgi:hypothetical protein